MKKYLLIIFCLFTIISTSQEDKLIGKVKSIREKEIFLNDSIQNYKYLSYDGDYGHSGFISPKLTIKRFYQHWYNTSYVHYLNYYKIFNPNGTTKEETWYNKDNTEIKKFEYLYNENDSIIQIKVINDNKLDVTNITYNYNKPITIIRYFSDEPNSYSYILNTFDEKGNLIKSSLFAEEGYDRSLLYTYNENNQIIERKLHIPTIWAKYNEISYFQKADEKGTTSILQKYIYDNANNLIDETTFNQPDYETTNDGINNKTTMKYDSKNNLIEKNYTSQDTTSKATMKYFYNKENKKTKSISQSTYSPNDFEEINYFYKNENIVKFTITKNKKKTIINIDYIFDNKGNWIEQTKSVNGKKMFVWKREILYYE